MFANPLLWLVALMLVVSAIFGAIAWMELVGVRREARDDHGFRGTRGMRGGEIALNDYERAYLRVHAPRRQLYVAGAAAVMALTTPLLLRLSDALMTGVWHLTGESRVVEPTFLVYQFGLFFLMIAFWAAIALSFARHFHKGTVERVEGVLDGMEGDEDASALALAVLGASAVAGLVYLTVLISPWALLVAALLALPAAGAWWRFVRG